MTKDLKFIIGVFLFSLLLIAGLVFLTSTKKSNTGVLSTEAVAGVIAEPEHYEFGDVPINGGLVTREYQITNDTGKDLKLIKLATSCMCTMANVQIGDKNTRFFGMEMAGDQNPPLSLELKKGETAKVTTRFDPAAHGPQGTGPFARSVYLYFDGGVKELTFNGVVTP